MGRYIPEFGYLNVLLGVEPVLRARAALLPAPARSRSRGSRRAGREPPHRARHRRHLRRHHRAGADLAKPDRRKGALEPAARERFVFEHARQIIEELEHTPSASSGAPLCLVAAHDDADHVAALMLAKLLPPAQTCVMGAPALAAEIVQDRDAEAMQGDS